MADLESTRGGEEGNTNSSSRAKKQGNQCKSWFMTFNNYAPGDLEAIVATMKAFPKSHRFKIQEETGENGTPHLQGVFEFKEACRWTEFKLPKAIHWEPTKNSEAAARYCAKLETRTGESISWGYPREIKLLSRLNFYPWQEDLVKMLEVEPDDRSVVWIYDPKGNSGKTQLCKWLIVHMDAIFCSSGKTSNLVNTVFNAVKAEARTDLVVFSMPRGTGGSISYTALESIKDGVLFNEKYEVGACVYASPHVVVFSNEFPDTSRLTHDRWRIFTIDENKLSVFTECKESPPSAAQIPGCELSPGI